jgi:hypothetical protein
VAVLKKSVALAPMLCGSGASANAELLETGALVEMVGASIRTVEERLPLSNNAPGLLLIDGGSVELCCFEHGLDL